MRRIDAWPFRVQIGWLTAVIAGVVVLLALGLGWWALSLGAQRLLAAQERLLRPIVEAALLTPMIERDQATVAEVVRELVRGESIDRVVVLGHDGRVWQEVAAPASPPLPWSSELRIPLTQGSLYFGEVRVRLNAAALADAAGYLVASALAVLGIGVGVAVWLLLGWGRHVGARLARLEQAAQGLARGDFSRRAGGDDLGCDEIGQLGRVFDDMAARIGRTVDQLVVSESRVSAILQSIGDGLVATDAAMRVTYLNPIAQALTGWTEAEALGRPVSEIMRIANALTGQAADLPIARVLETGHIVGLANHTELIARDGTRRHISDSAAPIRDASGTLVGVVMVFHDVSEAYRLRTSLEDNRTRLALALEASGFGLWDLQLTDDSMLLDKRARELLNVDASRTAISRGEWGERMHPEDRMAAQRRFSAHLAGEVPTYEAEFRVADGRGGWRWLGSRGRVTERLADGSPRRVTGTLADVSDRKAAQAQIQYLAFYDVLTGLPNRRLLQDRLHQAEALARRVGERGALIFIDLDRFKNVNDSRGHAVGDQLLQQVAARLGSRLRAADTLARLGGDEFVAIVTELPPALPVAGKHAHEVGESLRQALHAPFDIGGASYPVSASVGIALFPDGNRSTDELLSSADAAMYAAKQQGRDRVCFFDPAMQQAATE
ncbi:MAG: diguanylate cyclase, partial [Burkholderiaceae bacterium]|nr:diguanylate cyclase [Burkholderiaceae bacterium]